MFEAETGIQAQRRFIFGIHRQADGPEPIPPKAFQRALHQQFSQPLPAVVFPDGTIITAQGECEGSIAYEPRGEGGFGYDPIFELPDGRRMAEIDMEEKNRISHRAKALRAIEIKLKEYSLKTKSSN